jgi:predicted nucleic acid-binding protein
LARFLILDSEAVNALGRSVTRGVLRDRALAISRRAQLDRAERIVPLPVLAEVYRGDASDAGIDRLFSNGVRRLGIDLRTVRLAGRLRTSAGVGSAVDAIVVATAVRLGGAVVATADPEDFNRLAAGNPNVVIWSLNDR